MAVAARWRDYCGAGAGELEETLADVLDKMGIFFEKTRVPAYPAEVAMLGSSKTITVLNVLTPDPLTIRIVPVVGDPLMRICSRFFNDKGLVQRAAVLEINPLTESNRRVIGDIMGRVFQRLEQQPWQFSDLKFQLAVLLRLKIKRNWRRLLSGC